MLKNCLIAIWLFLLSSTLVAQHDYSGVWSEHIWWSDASIYIRSTSQYISLGGDVIIDSVSYKKVFAWADSNLTQAPKSWWPNYLGAIRIDSVGRLFFVDNSILKERLLYDFTANIGDTLHNLGGSRHGVCDSVTAIVLGIDSIEIVGAFHKTIDLKILGAINGYEFSWIEGIGNPQGFMVNTVPCVTDWGNDLLCYKEAGQLLYINSQDSACHRWAIGLETDPKNSDTKVIFTQNGTSTLQMRIAGEYKSPYTIELYDILGQLRISKQGYQNEMQISTGDLAAGYLLYRISNSEGQILRGRVPVLNY